MIVGYEIQRNEPVIQVIGPASPPVVMVEPPKVSAQVLIVGEGSIDIVFEGEKK